VTAHSLSIPETRYARSGDLDIAYQVLGSGSVDLIYVPGWVSHLDLYWQEPSVAEFFRRLASFSRLILFDRRGLGLSDRVPGAGVPMLEERMDDIRAVLDAVGSERAAVMGQRYGSPIAILFAATFPQRTAALVLYAASPKAGLKTDDYPRGPDAGGVRCLARSLDRGLGQRGVRGRVAPPPRAERR
jgi:pimeloyl-ACP methyl ester carboxylesterase